jgi:hypothetical protein
MSYFSDTENERSLRQRTKSSDGYTRISSEDDLDMLPSLSAYRNAKTIPRKQSTACKLQYSTDARIRHQCNCPYHHFLLY